MSKVLVIDDDRNLANLVREVLEMDGYTPILRHSGPDGIAYALKHTPDIILCDINIPGVDGYGVLARLRGHAKAADTRFYFFTGEVNLQPHTADGVIAKPFRVEDLLDTISGPPLDRRLA